MASGAHLTSLPFLIAFHHLIVRNGFSAVGLAESTFNRLFYLIRQAIPPFIRLGIENSLNVIDYFFVLSNRAASWPAPAL
jgi:hypothetical protein